jgi:hypothetical protein
VCDEVWSASFSAGYACDDSDCLFLSDENSFGLGRGPPEQDAVGEM